MKRFFFHYRKSDGKMTIHFNKQCIVVDEVVCKVPCETKRNKRQPRLVMRGFCNTVSIKKNYITNVAIVKIGEIL